MLESRAGAPVDEERIRDIAQVQIGSTRLAMRRSGCLIVLELEEDRKGEIWGICGASAGQGPGPWTSWLVTVGVHLAKLSFDHAELDEEGPEVLGERRCGYRTFDAVDTFYESGRRSDINE